MNTDLDAPLRPLHVERQARLDQWKKERTTLVAMTPTIIPGVSRKRQYLGCDGRMGSDDDDNNNGEEEEEECDSPIVTWGKIASTPLVAGGEKLSQMYNVNNNIQSSNHDGIHTDTCETILTKEQTFSLPCINDREKVVKKVEEKLARQKQRFEEAGTYGGGGKQGKQQQHPQRKTKHKTSEKETKLSTKQQSSLSMSALRNRNQSLTPAARSLLERSTLSLASSSSRRVSARSNSALGSALRVSYTPKRQKAGMSKSKQKDNVMSSSFLHKSTPL